MCLSATGTSNVAPVPTDVRLPGSFPSAELTAWQRGDWSPLTLRQLDDIARGRLSRRPERRQRRARDGVGVVEDRRGAALVALLVALALVVR